MEAVFKLSRAEVEEACLQYLARRDVRFAATPRLADAPGQEFAALVFIGEIALAPMREPPAPAALPPMQDAVFAPTPTPHGGVAQAPEPSPTPEVVVKTKAPALLGKPKSREAVLDLSRSSGSVKVEGLFSPESAPAVVRLPPSTVAYRNTTSG